MFYQGLKEVRERVKSQCVLPPFKPKEEPAAAAPAVSNVTNDHSVNTNTTNNTVNVMVVQNPMYHVNYWGQEDVSFIDKPFVKRLFEEAAARFPRLAEDPEVTAAAASWVFDRTMSLLMNDPSRPENLTAYIPNKKDGIPIVHGKEGWRAEPPVDTVYKATIARALDRLFVCQPFDENHELYSPFLIHLREQEKNLATGPVVPTKLMTSKGLIEKAMGKLPLAGDPPNRDPEIDAAEEKARQEALELPKPPLW